ncbi:hypothetical protein ACRRTK_010407 [Alexandromys fortis]
MWKPMICAPAVFKGPGSYFCSDLDDLRCMRKRYLDGFFDNLYPSPKGNSLNRKPSEWDKDAAVSSSQPMATGGSREEDSDRFKEQTTESLTMLQ